MNTDELRDRVYSAGPCPVCDVAGDIVFMTALGSAAMFWMCPGCGCAWGDLEDARAVNRIDPPERFAPDGFAPATAAELESAGLSNRVVKRYARDEIWSDPLFRMRRP